MAHLENQGLQQQQAKPTWWKRKSRGRKLPWTPAGMVLLLVIIITAVTSCGGSNQTASSTTATTAAAVSTESSTNTLAATTSTAQETTSTAQGSASTASKGRTYSDGTYLVGTDIPSGLYKGTVNTDQGYWAIATDADGSSIIASAGPTGQFYVEVKTGQYLRLAGVTIAKANLTKPATLPSTDISDGTYWSGPISPPAPTKAR